MSTAIETPAPVTTVQRSLRVPLEFVDDATWSLLRQTAAACARFANGQMAELYAGRMAVLADVEARAGRTNYRRWAESLPASLRDAIGREVTGAWRRHGKRILAGTQRLSLWSADRALCIRADRGALTLQRDEAGGLRFRLKILPGEDYEATRVTLPVYMPAVRRSRWLREPLDAMAGGIREITKGTVIFERPGRKLAMRLSYEVPLTPRDPAQLETAELAVDTEGALRLSSGSRWLSLADRVHRIASLKEHYAGITARLQRSLGKRGRHRDLRRALLKAGSFEAAAAGPLHALSREIVTWCQAQRVGVLTWAVIPDGTFPWDRLASMVQYKCVEAGISHLERSGESPKGAE